MMRMGKKKQPFYRIVVIEDDSPREGRYVDMIGFYNPMKDDEISLNESKAIEWLGKGAKPTTTVRGLLSKNGIMKKFHDLKISKKSE